MGTFIYWHWLIIALTLIIAESLGAAGLLIALGMAAALTGLVTWLFAFNWQIQLLFFSLVSILSTLCWWYIFRSHSLSTDSLLNRPLESTIGKSGILFEAIENGRGKIQLEGINWLVIGPDLPKGTTVKIIGVDEGYLIVRKLEL